MAHPSTRAAAHADIVYPAAIPFLLVHAACLLAFWSGVSWRALALCVGLYAVRIFAVGAGYHRYFSHRAFSTSRAFQFVLAFLAQSSAQSSVLWWAAKHRRHHLHSDTPQDTHSALHRGFLYSHVGWIFDRANGEADLTAVADLTRYPELRLLHRVELAPAVIVAVASYLMAGWSGVVVGFLWSTVLVWHATFCINSLAHLHGRRRYLTGDQSRNNWLLAILTMGEGWHNNHHAHQSSARQGFRWWEYDATYYLLWLAERAGLVWNLKRPPASVLRNEHRVGARVLERASEQLVRLLHPERIAAAITQGRGPADLAVLVAAMARARLQPVEGLAATPLPYMPTREDVAGLARRTLAETRHLEEVVDRARAMLMDAVCAALAAQDVSAYQVAPAWVTRSAGVIAVPEASDIAHVGENRAVDLALTPAALEEIDTAYSPPVRKMRLAMLEEKAEWHPVS